MMVPLNDLKGPFSRDAEAIVLMALTMKTVDAERLGAVWDADEDMGGYLDACAAVWDALTSSDRIFPIGWFEAIFADCRWAESTKALHPIADAVAATLVQDVVAPEVFLRLCEPWRVAMYTTVN